MLVSQRGWALLSATLVFVCVAGRTSVGPAADFGDRDRLVLASGDRPVAVYNAGFVPSPDPAQPWFGRSGFLHPVMTPLGRVVTDGFPADHLHQHGLMFAWTSSTFAGKPVDFWNSAKQEGRVEHAETLIRSSDRIEVVLRHVVTRADEDVVVLKETWRVDCVPHPTMHVLDLESTQTCATDRPLVIREYHYGGMCVRGPLHWNSGDAMLTSDGKGQPDGNHSRPNWVVISGVVDGQACGLAAFSHPSNYRSPQPVRLHPQMPYFCFAPMVLGDFQITEEEPYVSRFRFAAFDGPVDRDALENVWKSFAEERLP
ncbi:MAG: PmoA family protein [Pirellulales bacterium]|jgi:hypothetical protein